MDGSVMPANPGVNPSLMITAPAERAMSLRPNKGDQDRGRRSGPATTGSRPSRRATRPRRMARPENSAWTRGKRTSSTEALAAYPAREQDSQVQVAL
jgi:hypothetical protein